MPNISVRVDLVIWDPPFGLYKNKPGFLWDTEAPTKDQIVTMFNEISLLHADSRPSLNEKGLKWRTFAWIKGASMRPTKGSYTRSYEQILVVTVGELGPSATSHMPQRGEERPDFMFCPSVPDHGMWGKPPVNCAEKPTVIAKFFAHDLTPGGPNSNVLVLGSGSGAEIIGLSEMETL